MSIERHPNIHAVKFATSLLDFIYRNHRAPAVHDIRSRFELALRGRGRPNIEIGFDKLATEFHDIIVRRLDLGTRSDCSACIIHFVEEIEAKLDAAVDNDTHQAAMELLARKITAGNNAFSALRAGVSGKNGMLQSPPREA
jgi:hypothetical protein